MAAGYTSLIGRWVFRLSKQAGSGPEPPGPELCPCPDYKQDATLSNQFTQESSISNQFNNIQTLTSQWNRGPCNG